MEIRHPWHAHPLFLSDEAKSEDRCSICQKEFDGNPFYVCADCKYYAHKSCAQLPVEIQCHFHPQHPLVLRFGHRFACDSCHKTFESGLRFRCSACNFDLDVKCATMADINPEGKEFIRHFTHQHPLTICTKDGDNLRNCFACKTTSSDSIYGCSPCEYFLHKSCAEISTHVLHALHPEHPLSLVVSFGHCNYCELNDHTWKYYCTFCDFFWDLSCLIESGKDAQNSERSCFLCSKQHSDSDSCVDPLFLINQSCIQLPEEIEREFHSHKPLLLLDEQDFECNSCHKWFDKKSHYGCEECSFRMDVKCALMLSIEEHEERDEPIWPVIPHHFNHQHTLKLIREVDHINCSACNITKLSPIYGCIKCEYFLHQSCLELPIQIKHPLHDAHALTIQPLWGSFCHLCRRKYDGLFAFGCAQCLFFIGIECIFELRPTATVVHKYHPHLLCLIENSCCDRCDSDNTFCQLSEESSEFKLTKSFSLRCIECDYNLHLLCGPLPCTIKHRGHLHALKLVDSIVEDDSDEYYCDICEELRNPRLCIYYCEDCEFFAHVHCVISEIINALRKSHGKVKLRIVGDLRLEDTIKPSHNYLTEELLLDLLNRLDASEVLWLTFYFPHGKFFLRKEEEPWEKLEQKSSSEDFDVRGIIEELSFYNDDIFLNAKKRLEFFKPDTKYHLQPHECKLPLINVKGYKVTSNFVSLFRALLKKYGDFGQYCHLSKNIKSVYLYFVCRVLSDMRRTYIDNITEKQLFTWLYYIKNVGASGFELQFVECFLDRIVRSYFGLQAMKFEDEVVGRLVQEIANLEQKISEIRAKIEELKGCQQHMPVEIGKKSAVMKEIIAEAKLLKHKTAGEGIV